VDESGETPKVPHKADSKRKLSNIMPRYLSEKTPQEVFQEWINYTGFLCALSGVCLLQVQTSKSK
jgi:neurofibromin 1